MKVDAVKRFDWTLIKRNAINFNWRSTSPAGRPNCHWSTSTKSTKQPRGGVANNKITGLMKRQRHTRKMEVFFCRVC